MVLSTLIGHLLNVFKIDTLTKKVKMAVFAFPICFKENQKMALKISAYLAGITAVLISVPMAVIFANFFNFKTIEETVLVIHLGGSFTDFAIFKIGKTIQEIFSEGFDNFGDKIFNEKIFEIFCEKTKQNLKWNYKTQKECKRIKNILMQVLNSFFFHSKT